MALSVTPCSVALLAVPGPHGDARSRKVTPLGAVVVVAAAVVAALLAAPLVAAPDAAVVVAAWAAVVVAPLPLSLRLPLQAAATDATATTAAPPRTPALRIVTVPPQPHGRVGDGRVCRRARRARGWPT